MEKKRGRLNYEFELQVTRTLYLIPRLIAAQLVCFTGVMNSDFEIKSRYTFSGQDAMSHDRFETWHLVISWRIINLESIETRTVHFPNMRP